MKLKGKVAIVTGGSRGIGAAICCAFAKEGATVVIVNKNNPEDGAKIASQILDEGGLAKSMICDITNHAAVTDLIQQVIKQYNRIDILVNNAGVLIFKNIEEHSLEDWDFVVNTNLKSAFLLSRAVVPYMKNQSYGKIIFVSSVAAIRGISGTSAYSASKGGISALAKSMVAELAAYNINVNLITPGATATHINEELRKNPNFMQHIKQAPSGNHMMQAGDIAGSAVFLASEDSKNVHGLDLIIDGGVIAVQ